MFDKDKIKVVPQSPGVYLWKDETGKVIYVGKAKNLQVRMKQYFSSSKNYRIQKLVNTIDDFAYIITKSDVDALILERNQIRKLNPEFNVLLKDDKRYPYLKIQLKKELIIKLVRRISKDDAMYFGPFPNGYGARNILNSLIRIAKYKDGLPYESNDLNYWKKQYNKVKKILTTSTQQYKSELKVKMITAAEKMQYEIADEIKKTILALDAYKQKQIVELNQNKNIDVYGIIEKDGYLSICTMFYRYGYLLSITNRVLEINNDLPEMIRQYLNIYYENNLVPNEIYIAKDICSNNIGELKIVNPQKGIYKQLLNLANENANDNLTKKINSFIRKVELTSGAITELGKTIGIKKPYHILMIDNSHSNNENPVSAIVSYKNGIKQKNEYRKFNLETSERKADVDYMNQSITRYFSKEDRTQPSLLIVDGGLAQVHEVKKALRNLGIKLNVIGLVKNDRHKTDKIINLEEIKLDIDNNILLNFLTEIQEEVDRFAKVQHRKRNELFSLEGHIEKIKGVGNKTLNKLLNYFKTYSSIYNASIIELEKVVSKEIAQKIWKEFHG